MYEKNYKELGCAVALQALKDYFVASAAKQRAIIKDLNSPWMTLITERLSVYLAEKLVSNPKEVKARYEKYERRD